MLAAVAIVPAYNEVPRLAAVLRPLVASGQFARVLVVDDGSTDGTADAARAAGAAVLRMPRNGGKGAAMRVGVAFSREPVVAFFDADLTGLHPEHVADLLGPVRDGTAGMSVGLMDYGIYNFLQQALPAISGQRAVRRELLARVPADCWRGFRIEVGLNAAAQRAGVAVETRVLRGVGQVAKWHKVGAREGVASGARMLIEVLRALRDVGDGSRG